MGYALLWIEFLAVLLLAVAVMTAIAARWKRRWLRLLLVVVAGLLPLALLSCLIYWAAYLEFGRSLDAGNFWPLLMLGVLYAVGAAAIVLMGMRRRDKLEAGDETTDKARCSAATWSPQRLGLSLLVACALFAMTWWNLDAAVKVQLAAIRAEAGALALSAAPARVPDRENAALVYERAFEIDGLPQKRPPEWNDIWTDAATKESDFDFTDERLAAFLEEKRPVLVLLREAAARDGCYFDRDFARPRIDMLMDEVQQLRDAARLLAVDARHQAATGHADVALDDVNAIYGIARHVEGEGLLISLLVSIAIDAVACETLEEVLAEGNVDTADLAHLELDESVSYRHALVRSFRMEEAFGLSVFASFDNADALRDLHLLGAVNGGAQPTPSLSESPLGGLAISGFRVFLLPIEVDAYRKFIHQAREFSSRPYPWPAEAKRSFENEAETSNGYLTRLLVPALTSGTDATQRGDAKRALARAALAVYRYRAEQGELPERLNDLLPKYLDAVPIDPFNGKPIRYKRGPTGAMLYSLGPNLTDDDGEPFDWNQGQQRGDIVFRLGESP